jgi:hypothetical protein
MGSSQARRTLTASRSRTLSPLDLTPQIQVRWSLEASRYLYVAGVEDALTIRHGLSRYVITTNDAGCDIPPVMRLEVRRARLGLASGLALAARPAGLAEAPGSTARRRRVRAERGCGAPLTLEGPTRTMRGVPACGCDVRPAIGTPCASGVGLVLLVLRGNEALRRGPAAAGGGAAVRDSRRARRAAARKGASEAAALLRRVPGDPGHLRLVILTAHLARLLAPARVTGPGRKAWRAEGAPLKP